jgi:hypothetical protein
MDKGCDLSPRKKREIMLENTAMKPCEIVAARKV